MKPSSALPPAILCALLLTGLACGDDDEGPTEPPPPEELAEGEDIFRFDTFGNETFWTDTLRLHEVIQAGVSPLTALSVGLKVDADALPPGTLESADLSSPGNHRRAAQVERGGRSAWNCGND